jgi:hypothetical protein
MNSVQCSLNFIFCFSSYCLVARKPNDVIHIPTYSNGITWFILQLSCNVVTIFTGSQKFFQKSRTHLKILGARRVTWSRLNTEDPQILGIVVQILIVTETWRPGFVHPWLRLRLISTGLHILGSSLCIAVCAKLTEYCEKTLRLPEYIESFS